MESYTLADSELYVPGSRRYLQLQQSLLLLTQDLGARFIPLITFLLCLGLHHLDHFRTFLPFSAVVCPFHFPTFALHP